MPVCGTVVTNGRASGAACEPGVANGVDNGVTCDTRDGVVTGDG